ncbi:hypothetical protein B0H14DRAFT_3159564, partial [Mycena olivaceomarginata]
MLPAPAPAHHCALPLCLPLAPPLLPHPTSAAASTSSAAQVGCRVAGSCPDAGEESERIVFEDPSETRMAGMSPDPINIQPMARTAADSSSNQSKASPAGRGLEQLKVQLGGDELGIRGRDGVWAKMEAIELYAGEEVLRTAAPRRNIVIGTVWIESYLANAPLVDDAFGGGGCRYLHLRCDVTPWRWTSWMTWTRWRWGSGRQRCGGSRKRSVDTTCHGRDVIQCTDQFRQVWFNLRLQIDKSKTNQVKTSNRHPQKSRPRNNNLEISLAPLSSPHDTKTIHEPARTVGPFEILQAQIICTSGDVEFLGIAKQQQWNEEYKRRVQANEQTLFRSGGSRIGIDPARLNASCWCGHWTQLAQSQGPAVTSEVQVEIREVVK